MKVAVFGKSGGGKSTFSKKLSLITNTPLLPLDQIEYLDGGEKASEEQYLAKYNNILNNESWIIEGFGTIETFRERLKIADTLIYIDLPMRIHYWRVMKRFLLSPFVKPEGWPDNSPMIRSTYNSYVHLFKVAPKFWNSSFLTRLENMSEEKKIYHLTSAKEFNKCIVEINSKLTKKHNKNEETNNLP